MTSAAPENASTGASEKVVFKVSPASALKLFGGSVAFVLLGYYNLKQQPAGSTLYTISEFGIWFFALGIVVGLLQLFGFTSNVTLNADGLSYRHQFMKTGPIPWSAMRSVTIESRGAMSSGRSRGIVVIDAGEWRDVAAKLSSPEARQAVAKVREKFGNRPVRIVASTVGTTAEELAAAIQRRIDSFEQGRS